VGWPAGLTLALLSLLSAVGFVALSMFPTLGMVMCIQVLYSAGRHGVTRPARETLFTVLSRLASGDV
jgi:AAA family ATP:ADP antiporter